MESGGLDACAAVGSGALSLAIWPVRLASVVSVSLVCESCNTDAVVSSTAPCSVTGRVVLALGASSSTLYIAPRSSVRTGSEVRMGLPLVAVPLSTSSHIHATHPRGGLHHPALCVRAYRPSSLLSYFAPCIPIPALPAEMVNLLAALSLPRALAIAASVVALWTAVRRRYFSPISDVPGPFWGSVSLFWQLHKIFTKHTERATIDAHKRWGMS